MTEHSADIIIVGGGIMGCSTAYQLAKAGQRVLLLEQFQIGHTQGSSHGPSRIIRLAYDGLDYVQLARAAYEHWHELELDSGLSLMQKMGGLDFGPPDAFAMDGIRATMQAAGVPFEDVDATEIMRRYPQFKVPDDTVGTYQADYSLLAADACVAAYAAQARRYGGTIRESEPVRSFRPTAHGVEVITDQATYSADRLILSAGAWMRPLLQQIGIDLPLKVIREQLAFFRPPDPENYLPGRFPIFLNRVPGKTIIRSGFPIWGNIPAVKLMVDRIAPEVDPGETDRTVHPGRLDTLREFVASLLPNIGDDIIHSVVCLYTMTPDEDFIIDFHPEHSQIIIASPCSGHGFKFASVIGRVLADLAVKDSTEYPIGRFGLSRFK